MKIIGFCGWSGSGKTDLICRIIKYLSSQELFISTIKHTHHNIEIDKKGLLTKKDFFNILYRERIYSETLPIRRTIYGD